MKGVSMIRVSLSLVLGAMLLAAVLAMGLPSAWHAATSVDAPVLQATASTPPIVVTPAPTVAPTRSAPIGEGTQQALTITGLVLLSALLIGGGIYVRRRWMATRY
jgi:hypothetical protein